MPSVRIGLVVIAMLGVTGISAAAQTGRPAQPPTAVSSGAGPWAGDAVAGLSPVSAAGFLTPMVDRPRAGRDVAMMAVGGAAILVGALIVGGDAGTIFVVSGAAIALYGLYNYLR